MNPRLHLLVILLASLAFAALSGCAEERDPIDRVQPYALEKTFFVGEDLVDISDDPEFWTQATLIDVGYGAKQGGLFTSTYAQPMSRVKWQITEDLLIARLAYERVETSDGKGVGGMVQDGVIAAAFRIEKHFDIINAYNSTTGEKLNVIEENSIDRPWYEREYMRVDWSRSLNVDSYDFDTLSLLGIYGGVTYEPLAFFVEDPNDPQAPQFDLEDGYFDVTLKAFAKPGVIDLSHFGWGIDSFPACYLENDFLGGSWPSGSCSPVELTLRHSFRRVVDEDYAPVDWDGYRFQSYGGFYVERMGYERKYGMTDSQWYRFLARYPIWERSFYYDDPAAMTGPVDCFTPDTTGFGEDPNRDADGNGTADECELVTELTGVSGSQCNTFRQQCTLPFRVRTLEPIPWHFSNGSDTTYYDATADATHEWDVALRMGAQTALYVECVRTGGEDCATAHPVTTGQQTDNVDAVRLAAEIDDCRNGVAYEGQDCDALVGILAEQRGLPDTVAAVAAMDEMIVLCHSPVEHDDDPACGSPRLPEGVTADQCNAAYKAGYGPTFDAELLDTCRAAINARMGDLRYQLVNVMSEPQTPSPWGIYTDAEDPLTGMTISASINVWAPVNDMFSAKIIDTLRYMSGELTIDEITEGEYVHKWADAFKAANGGGVFRQMTKAEVERRIHEFAADSLGLQPSAEAAQAHREAAMAAEPLPPEVMAKAKELHRDLKGVRASLDAASAMKPIYTARRNHAHGSDHEASLITKMMQQLHGAESYALTDEVMDMISPLRGGNPSLQRDLQNMREVALADHGRCILREAAAPVALKGLGKVLQEKFGEFNPSESDDAQIVRAERMRDYVRRMAHYSVVIHEMGHSIGMRHNFVSSSDAWSYRPQYWQLRTKNGSVNSDCNGLAADGTGCVGPRYYDPITEEEEDGLIWTWMHSSVMDYAGELTQDMLGLGVYDFAAARMFYADSVAVAAEGGSEAGTARGLGLVAKMDSFGGILGIAHQIGQDEIHYSRLQAAYTLVRDCEDVDPEDFRPASWDTERDGEWHPLMDGLMVEVDGAYSKCQQPPVDYAAWDDLRSPQSNEISGYFGGGPCIDPDDRVRMPYGFATDRWADLGNLSVYRHDNGADPYELFDFFIAQQEMFHIFDNYRRGRAGFSVRSAASRTLHRYNTKMRDGAKGLGLLRNIYKDFALALGYEFSSYWPSLAPYFYPDNILASVMGFDHFARQLARPEIGAHYLEDGVLVSSRDTAASAGPTVVTIPNGATGALDDIGYGGKLLENLLASDAGEFDSDFTVNAGSYYDKIYTAMLMTESIDNFISSSRTDFLDARYRAVSLADLLPDGYRRWLGNNLTGSTQMKGARLVAGAANIPKTDGQGYPLEAIGWTSWWGDEPTTCFPRDGVLVCDVYGFDEFGFTPAEGNDNVVPIDPQVGWEQQKFLIAWTMAYLPENQQQMWIDMLRVWELGADDDPGFANRIEFHNPTGKVYVAKSYGKEEVFGQTVHRGIAARVLEYANGLLEAAYVVDPVDNDADGEPDWYVPIINGDTGLPIVKHDPSVQQITEDGGVTAGKPGCHAGDYSQCDCSSNRACVELESYVEVPFYLRQAMHAYGVAEPEMKGVW